MSDARLLLLRLSGYIYQLVEIDRTDVSSIQVFRTMQTVGMGKSKACLQGGTRYKPCALNHYGGDGGGHLDSIHDPPLCAALSP